MEITRDYLLNDKQLKQQRAWIGLAAFACECVLSIPEGYRLREEVDACTQLTSAKLLKVSNFNSPEGMVELRHHHLSDLYFVLVLGSCVLRSPFNRTLRVVTSDGTPTGNRQYNEIQAETLAFADGLLPVLERWLQDQVPPPLPVLPNEGENVPIGTEMPPFPAEMTWAERRARLTLLFQRGEAEITSFVTSTLPALTKPAKATAKSSKPRPADLLAAEVPTPARRGPFLRRAFTEGELSAVRLLLTYVPDLARLLPNYPLALALQTLSSYQPPARLTALRTALQPLKPNQPLHLTLDESLTLVQTLHAGALLLLPDTVERVSRQLRKRLAEGEALSDECRTDCSRLLLLFTDAATSQNFRATFGPLLKSFLAAVDRTYPHAAEPKQARAEVAELVALR